MSDFDPDCPVCHYRNCSSDPRFDERGNLRQLTPEQIKLGQDSTSEADRQTFAGTLSIKIMDKPKESCLQEAQRLVYGERGVQYGHPFDDYTRTAGMVSSMLAHKLREPLTAEEMILIMCCVKLSRQINAPKRDNMTDLAGYAECEQRTVDRRAELEGDK
jgi:hypothetical protein